MCSEAKLKHRSEMAPKRMLVFVAQMRAARSYSPPRLIISFPLREWLDFHGLNSYPVLGLTLASATP